MPSERLYAVRLTEQTIRVVSKGLEGLKYRVAAPVIDDITRQVNAPAPCASCAHAVSVDGSLSCRSPAAAVLGDTAGAGLPAAARDVGACVLRKPL